MNGEVTTKLWVVTNAMSVDVFNLNRVSTCAAPSASRRQVLRKREVVRPLPAQIPQPGCRSCTWSWTMRPASTFGRGWTACAGPFESTASAARLRICRRRVE